MKIIRLISVLLLAMFCGMVTAQKQPNIVIVYVDDLGYGDLSCYGATQVKTPNVDALAEGGIVFTDGHCTSATCTPSRYSLLTGTYAFRANAKVLSGDAAALIKPGTPTIASMLKQHGYQTAVIGKWHLGLGENSVDWNKYIPSGPKEIGFDYSYLIPATGDRVPCVMVENQRVVNLDPNDPIKVSYKEKVGNDPTYLENPELATYGADKFHAKTIVNGVSRIGYMTGGNSARWNDETIPYLMLDKANTFIDNCDDKPFFLYFAFHDIHVPRMPDDRFKGATEMGPRGDAIVQMDYITGQLINYLKAKKKLDNTLIIFSSDNGPVLSDGYEDQAIELIGDHKPGGPYRGGKYSALEAGTRVPTIVYWSGMVEGGQTSNKLISQVDIYASLAQLVGHKLEYNEALDSENYLDVWLGKKGEGRTYLVEDGAAMALRFNEWKYIRPAESLQKHKWIAKKHIEAGSSLEPQLYNLKEDKVEKENLAGKEKELLKKLEAKLAKIIEDERTRMESY